MQIFQLPTYPDLLVNGIAIGFWYLFGAWRLWRILKPIVRFSWTLYTIAYVTYLRWWLIWCVVSPFLDARIQTVGTLTFIVYWAFRDDIDRWFRRKREQSKRALSSITDVAQAAFRRQQAEAFS